MEVNANRALDSRDLEGSQDRKAVIEEFRRLYGKDPPKRLSASILAMAIAYRNQEVAQGGLKPALVRRLMAHAEADASTSKPKTTAPRSIKPGTVLLREWQGRSYSAQVIEEGVVFQGKIYRSLSQVAKQITGQHWSGPRFFGLLGPASKETKVGHG